MKNVSVILAVMTVVILISVIFGFVYTAAIAIFGGIVGSLLYYAFVYVVATDGYRVGVRAINFFDEAYGMIWAYAVAGYNKAKVKTKSIFSKEDKIVEIKLITA